MSAKQPDARSRGQRVATKLGRSPARRARPDAAGHGVASETSRVRLAIPADGTRYAEGAASVFLGVIVWSLSGILLRLVESAGLWTLVFYRSAFMALTLFAILAVTHRGRVLRAFRAAGWLGVLGGLCFAASSISYISSLITTTVANAAFLGATSPIFAAILGWAVNRERVAGATWAAMALALGGVALMLGEGVAAGRLLGNVLGLVAAVAFACQMVVLRAGRAIDMTPAMCLGASFASLAGLLMADSLAIPLHDLGITFVMGSIQLAAPLALITFGSRHLPAVQLSLLTLLDAVFNPLWVWWGVGEVPSGLTLIGGAIVFLAIAGEAVLGARRAQKAI